MDIPSALEKIINDIKSQYKKALDNQQEVEYLNKLEQSVNKLNYIYKVNNKKDNHKAKNVKKEQLEIFDLLNQSRYTPKVSRIQGSSFTQSIETLPDILGANLLAQETSVNLQLTSSQKKVFIALKKFMSNKNKKYFRLTGYAGTGKTYLITKLMQWLKSQGLCVIAASPTNKASKNLFKLAIQNGLDIDSTTISKLLKQQPEINPESGKEDFVSNEEVDLQDYHVIIFDEFSMISKQNFTEIINATNHVNTKLIFVGDEAQLPPVGEKYPIVAISDFIDNYANLTEVVRYDGEIGKIAEAIRSNPQFQHQVYPFSTTTDETIIVINRQEWLNQVVKYFQSANFDDNSDYCRMLVWRNKTADSLNHWLRKQLWGENASSFVKEDILIAKKPVFRLATNPKPKKKKEWRIVMNNSEECKVIGEAELISTSNYDFWQVPVITDADVELILRILTPESEQKRQEELKQLRKAKDWLKLINLDKSYDYCSFAYSLTTHKAQGSTIDYVFLDLADIRLCSDLQKILYTALTRAKVRAYICY